MCWKILETVKCVASTALWKLLEKVKSVCKGTLIPHPTPNPNAAARKQEIPNVITPNPPIREHPPPGMYIRCIFTYNHMIVYIYNYIAPCIAEIIWYSDTVSNDFFKP